MAWTNTTHASFGQQYNEGSESLVIPDPGGASEASVESSNLSVDVSDSRFLVSLTVTETSGANGNANTRLQASFDGATWHTVDTATLAVDTTGANTGTDDHDATGWFAPYWRIQVFTDGTDILDSATVTLGYADLGLSRRTGATKY